MKLTPQDEQVLAHLESGKHLTPLEALGIYNIFRLAARIYSIKAYLAGQHDSRRIVMTRANDAMGKPYARYTLVKPTPAPAFDRTQSVGLNPHPAQAALMRAPYRLTA